jgi:preprotein translocase subunit YajC
MGSDMIIAAQQSGGGALNLLLLLAIPLVFYFLLIRPQSKRRKEQMQMQSSLEPGARVLTTSGIYAEVVRVDDDGLELEIADGVTIRVVKQAVMQVVQDDETGDDDLSDEADEADEADDAGESAEDETAPAKADLSKDGGDEATGDEDRPAAQGAGAGKGKKSSG